MLKAVQFGALVTATNNWADKAKGYADFKAEAASKGVTFIGRSADYSRVYVANGAKPSENTDVFQLVAKQNGFVNVEQSRDKEAGSTLPLGSDTGMVFLTTRGGKEPQGFFFEAGINDNVTNDTAPRRAPWLSTYA